MYQGNNPTAIQSQKMITQALLSLMKIKKFSKIQIKELCEYAKVSRQTFYSLFGNKEQILELYFDQIFAKYIGHMKKIDNLSLSIICTSSITYLIKHSQFIELLVANNLNYIMIKKLKQYLLEFAEVINANTTENHNYAIAFLAGALVETIGAYIQNNQFKDAKEISNLIETILSGNYFIVH